MTVPTVCPLASSPRIMRREWKRNKPYLPKSNSLPSLHLVPSNRPLFTCQRCGFANTLIPLCLWCSWTSESAKHDFEKATPPRTRRASAPSKSLWVPKSDTPSDGTRTGRNSRISSFPINTPHHHDYDRKLLPSRNDGGQFKIPAKVRGGSEDQMSNNVSQVTPPKATTASRATSFFKRLPLDKAKLWTSNSPNHINDKKSNSPNEAPMMPSRGLSVVPTSSPMTRPTNHCSTTTTGLSSPTTVDISIHRVMTIGLQCDSASATTTGESCLSLDMRHVMHGSPPRSTDISTTPTSTPPPLRRKKKIDFFRTSSPPNVDLSVFPEPIMLTATMSSKKDLNSTMRRPLSEQYQCSPTKPTFLPLSIPHPNHRLLQHIGKEKEGLIQPHVRSHSQPSPHDLVTSMTATTTTTLLPNTTTTIPLGHPSRPYYSAIRKGMGTPRPISLSSISLPPVVQIPSRIGAGHDDLDSVTQIHSLLPAFSTFTPSPSRLSMRNAYVSDHNNDDSDDDDSSVDVPACLALSGFPYHNHHHRSSNSNTDSVSQKKKRHVRRSTAFSFTRVLQSHPRSSVALAPSQSTSTSTPFLPGRPQQQEKRRRQSTPPDALAMATGALPPPPPLPSTSPSSRRVAHLSGFSLSGEVELRMALALEGRRSTDRDGPRASGEYRFRDMRSAVGEFGAQGGDSAAGGREVGREKEKQKKKAVGVRRSVRKFGKGIMEVVNGLNHPVHPSTVSPK